MVDKKKLNAWGCTSIRHATCISCIVQDEWISETSFGLLYICKRQNVLQMFFFNLVEVKPAYSPNNKNFKHYAWYLRFFRQF